MALIKCPECGRENVSDSAESCPNCGYGIKVHFDKIKKEEEQKRNDEEKQKEEAERQKKAIAEKKRLEEVHKKEEEREIRERKQRLEEQKRTKICMIILAICAMFFLVHFCAMSVTEDNRKNALRDLADKSFATDFNTYLKEINNYGLNIDATYELKQNSDSYKDGVLTLTCVVKYTSDDINQYRDVGYDSAEAKKLCFLLKDIAEYEQKTLHYTYTSDDGTVKIDVPDDYGNPRIAVYDDKEQNKYEYSYVVGYDELEINGDYAYMESDGSYQPSSSSSSSSSYTGSYDATLEYGSGSVLVCISKDAMDRYLSALNNSNQGTIDEMESSGEIGWTAKGTKCNIVDRGIGTYQVKLLDGIYEGNTVYVISESVNEK